MVAHEDRDGHIDIHTRQHIGQWFRTLYDGFEREHRPGRDLVEISQADARRALLVVGQEQKV